jgi:hypothetical protein
VIDDPPTTREEAERQVTAAVERYREVASSKDKLGLPETGQHVAEKAVERALVLLSFLLKRAVASGVSRERLTELTGWETALVQELLDRPAERVIPVSPRPR